MAKSGIGGVVILNCTCNIPYQDKIYGMGKRVHNLKKTGMEANCTGCGTKHSTGRAALEEKKKGDKEIAKEKETKPKERQKEKPGNKK
jgi:hypothetical protein